MRRICSFLADIPAYVIAATFLFLVSCYFAVLVLYIKIAGLILRNSEESAIDLLAKNPGPFTDAAGRQVYVWIDMVEPQEENVIGRSFLFHLKTEKPPAGYKIPQRNTMHCRVRGTYNRENGECLETRSYDDGYSETRKGKVGEDGREIWYDSESLHAYGFSFFPHITAAANITHLKEFIRTST